MHCRFKLTVSSYTFCQFMKTIKEEDLMSYLYNEASPAVVEAIEQALQEDPSLKNQLDLLKISMKALDKVKLKSPSKASLKAILKYAADKNKEA